MTEEWQGMTKTKIESRVHEEVRGREIEENVTRGQSDFTGGAGRVDVAW